jgi:hypothetical protein
MRDLSFFNREKHQESANLHQKFIKKISCSIFFLWVVKHITRRGLNSHPFPKAKARETAVYQNSYGQN